MMTPYKDPEKQAEYQTNWTTSVRRNWLQKQECELCGRRMNLRVFRHVGAPRLSWSLKGPSHNKFRVTCADATACLQKAEEPKAPEPKQEPKQLLPASVVRKRYRTAAARESAASDVVEPAPSKIRKDLAKLDRRPVCPKHGPKGTMLLNKRARFVCCGREVR